MSSLLAQSNGSSALLPAGYAVPAHPTSTRGPIRAGLLVIVVFFLGFGSWASLAPLGSAVVAHGSIIVDTKRKAIQHLEPGIVHEILVKDGDHVSAGQVLVRLDDTQ